jgi:hypothetical protein
MAGLPSATSAGNFYSELILVKCSFLFENKVLVQCVCMLVIKYEPFS